MGRTISPDELARRIEAVTLESVTGLARRMLDPRRVALAAVGPEALPGEDDLRQALERGDSG
jgi:predicted Zn-dependent peptidase